MNRLPGGIVGMTDEDAPTKYNRAGKIKIGEKTEKAARALDYFRIDCPDEDLVRQFHEVYGEKPTELPVIFFDNDIDNWTFYTSCEYWKGQVLWCHGNGHVALRYALRPGDGPEAYDPQKVSEQIEVPCFASPNGCPYYKKKGCCSPRGYLRFLIPDLNTMGYFELKVAESSFQGIMSPLRSAGATMGSLVGSNGKIYMFSFKNKSNQKVNGVKLDIWGMGELPQVQAQPHPVSDPVPHAGADTDNDDWTDGDDSPAGEEENVPQLPDQVLACYSPSEMNRIQRILAQEAFVSEDGGWWERMSGVKSRAEGRAMYRRVVAMDEYLATGTIANIPTNEQQSDIDGCLKVLKDEELANSIRVALKDAEKFNDVENIIRGLVDEVQKHKEIQKYNAQKGSS